MFSGISKSRSKASIAPILVTQTSGPPTSTHSPTPTNADRPSKRRFGSFFSKGPKQDPPTKPPASAPAPSRPPFEFEGKGPDEVQLLLRTVWRFAHARSKEEDSRWKAQFAGVCMTGKALEWYQTLDSSTRNDWELLREALQLRFPAVRDRSDSIDTPASPPPQSLPTLLSTVSEADLSQGRRSSVIRSPIVPIPAGVPSAFRSSQYLQGSPPSSVAAAAPTSPVNVTFGESEGRLRIVADGLTVAAAAATKGPYVDKELLDGGWFGICPTAGDALRVRFDPEQGPHSLRLTHSKNQWLGLQWAESNTISSSPSNLGATLTELTPDAREPWKTISTAPSEFKGPSSIPIWDIYPDGTIGIFYNGKDAIYPLVIALVTEAKEAEKPKELSPDDVVLPPSQATTPAKSRPLPRLPVAADPLSAMPGEYITVTQDVAEANPPDTTTGTAPPPTVPELNATSPLSGHTTASIPSVSTAILDHKDPSAVTTPKTEDSYRPVGSTAIFLVRDFDLWDAVQRQNPNVTVCKARLVFEPV